MTREEWEKGIEQWQKSGGREGSKLPDPKADPQDDSGGGWMGSIGAGLKGAGRELATQGGFAKDFAQGSDPEHPTAEWLGREAVDMAPAAALDAFAPEIGIFPTAWRGARFANEILNAAGKGALGGAAASPGDRRGGATSGAETSGAASAAGQLMARPAVHRALLPAAILAEVAQHGGMIPHGLLGGLYPWAMAHGLSALGGLARSAGFKAPALTGAAGSQVERSMEGDGSQ